MKYMHIPPGIKGELMRSGVTCNQKVQIVGRNDDYSF